MVRPETIVELPPPVAMLGIVQGYWASRAVYAAAKLGIADLLAAGPKSCSELAIVQPSMGVGAPLPDVAEAM